MVRSDVDGNQTLIYKAYQYENTFRIINCLSSSNKCNRCSKHKVTKPQRCTKDMFENPT